MIRTKRWCRFGKRSKRSIVVTLVTTTVIFCMLYYVFKTHIKHSELNENLHATKRYIETKLEEALKEDKGTGCEFPYLDPFSKEITQFEGPTRNISCSGQSSIVNLGRNWVRCYLSECRVVNEILASFRNIECTYRDIIYVSDDKRSLGSPVAVFNGDVYTLRRSDHVKVKCKGRHIDHFISSNWAGVAIGFRTDVERKVPPPGREDSLDVLILGFDSTSTNRFIRKMPKSYEYLKHELGAVIMDKYHIIGVSTVGAVFPILIGKNEFELPDVTKSSKNHFNITDLIFNTLKEDGYRTLYFEDMPWVGTFQFRFNGFLEQPADHFLRAFHQEEFSSRNIWPAHDYFCVGDTLNYKLMMNVTEQFFKLDGKHFAFTLIADITHDDLDIMGIADHDTMSFLKSLKQSGMMDHTLVIVMGDHGFGRGSICDTLQGKLEQRMPLMAIRLPETLKRRRPDVEAILRNNSQVLTTPYDIHATLLDAMDLQQYYNDYRIKGADLTRGLSLLQRIPASRSCSEAGIEPHWCACVAWDAVPSTEAIYSRAAKAFVHYINTLTEPVRLKCVPRTLTSIWWVKRRRDAIQQSQNPNYTRNNSYYQIKVSVGPGYGVFEATTAYFIKEDTLVFDVKDISRTSSYNGEPSCISATHPHLNFYCYCQ